MIIFEMCSHDMKDDVVKENGELNEGLGSVDAHRWCDDECR